MFRFRCFGQKSVSFDHYTCGSDGGAHIGIRVRHDECAGGGTGGTAPAGVAVANIIVDEGVKGGQGVRLQGEYPTRSPLLGPVL